MDALRTLERLLFAEGTLAEREGRTGDAANSYIDVIRLGQAAGRGGMMMDVLRGQAIEAAGLRGLAGLRGRLDVDQVRRLLPELIAIDRAGGLHGGLRQ